MFVVDITWYKLIEVDRSWKRLTVCQLVHQSVSEWVNHDHGSMRLISLKSTKYTLEIHQIYTKVNSFIQKYPQKYTGEWQNILKRYPQVSSRHLSVIQSYTDTQMTQIYTRYIPKLPEIYSRDTLEVSKIYPESSIIQEWNMLCTGYDWLLGKDLIFWRGHG